MRNALALLITALALAGCSVHRPMESARNEYAMPETFQGQPTTAVTGSWWTSFENEPLDEMVDTALLDNLTVRSAWSRLEQARQLAIVSGAARYPNLNLGLTGQKIRYEEGTGPAGISESENWQASGTISWQVDLWRKINSTSKAAVLDAEAGRFDLEATAHTIAGSVTDTWFALTAERATLRLLSEQAAVSRNFLELVEFRFTNGLASALEVFQQRSALAAVEALVPESEASVQVLENTLNLLLGREPGSPVPETMALPSLPARFTAGLPATVLRNRPDVRSAELRLIASDYRLAAAIADRFPSLSLTYTFGGQSTEFKNVLDDWFTNLAGNLLVPVFSGGRLKAEAERNRAIVEERYLGWQAALLTAWNEVENGLVTEDGLVRSMELINGQVTLANNTLARSRDQYVNGLVDYLNVLTSLQTLQQLERQQIRTHQALLKNRVALHLASGGDWSRTLTPRHVESTEQPEENQ